MLALADLEYVQREAMTRDMFLRDRVPATVLDGNARLSVQGLKTNADVSHPILREGRLPPSECEVSAGTPVGYPADLERFPTWQVGYQAAAFAGLEAQRSIASGRELKKPVGAPPNSDVLGKNLERFLGTRFHAHRDDYRAHLRLRSTCVLNDAS